MPTYTFVCSNCNQKYEMFFTISQYTENQKCKNCDTKLERSYIDDLSQMTSSIIKTDDELKTIGDLANRNRDKMSDDHKQHLHNKHNAYKHDYNDFKLPQGMHSLRRKK